MYNHSFIFNECGFDSLPKYIDKDLLFNVSYEINTGEIKLYILNNEKTFLYKISKNQIVKQHDAVETGADPTRLSQYLETEFDFDDLLLDTVEQDNYYLYVEDTSRDEYLKLLNAICRKAGIQESDLIATMNRINQIPIANLRTCHHRQAISLVRVPFTDNRFKFYARPFVTRNPYELTEKTTQFLAQLYDCDTAEVPKHIKHLWVSSELFSDRVVVTTQHHSLYHH